jgi:hypothetical protein
MEQKRTFIHHRRQLDISKENTFHPNTLAKEISKQMRLKKMLGYVVDVIIFDFSTKRKGMFFYNKRV